MRRVLNVIFCCAVLLIASSPMWAQAMAQVKGQVTDQEGKPMVGAKIEMKNLENGQKYNLKTDKKGQFFSIGVSSGHYDITVYDSSGKSVTQGPVYKNVNISLSGNGSGQNQGINMLDINFQQMMAQHADETQLELLRQHQEASLAVREQNLQAFIDQQQMILDAHKHATQLDNQQKIAKMRPGGKLDK